MIYPRLEVPVGLVKVLRSLLDTDNRSEDESELCTASSGEYISVRLCLYGNVEVGIHTCSDPLCDH